MLLLDVTVVNGGPPKIEKEPHASCIDLAWIVDAYATRKLEALDRAARGGGHGSGGCSRSRGGPLRLGKRRRSRACSGIALAVGPRRRLAHEFAQLGEKRGGPGTLPLERLDPLQPA